MIVTWVNAALLSAAIMALVSVFDSHLVTKRFPALRTFLLPVGVIHLTYGVIGYFVFGLPASVDESAVLIAVVSSCVRTGGILILLDSLRHREVSRVIPVIYMYPMFVALLAFFVLGERLAAIQWIAVVVVALGAVMISSGREQLSLTSVERPRSALLFVAAVLFAVADVTGKHALSEIDFSQLFWIGAAAMGTIFISIGLRKRVVSTISSLPRGGQTLGLLLMNEMVAPLGIVISYWALERGPVSLVSALLSSRPFFVLIFALVLSRRAPAFLFWEGGRKLLIIRIVATAMIVAGIAVIEAY